MDEAHAKELLEEKLFVHKIYEEKIKHAWQVLIVALAIPVSAGSLQLPNIDFVNARFIMLAACLIGNTVFAYSIWIYREVYAYQNYLASLEAALNNYRGTEYLAWELKFNPYRSHEKAVGAIFGTMFVSMIIASALSVLYAIGLIKPDPKLEVVEWYIVGPIVIAYIALYCSVVAIIRGLIPSFKYG